MLIREGLEYATTLYEKGTKKIKNKTIRGAVKFDWQIFLLVKELDLQVKDYLICKQSNIMSKSISNLEMEKIKININNKN